MLCLNGDRFVFAFSVFGGALGLLEHFALLGAVGIPPRRCTPQGIPGDSLSSDGRGFKVLAQRRTVAKVSAWVRVLVRSVMLPYLIGPVGGGETCQGGAKLIIWR